MAGPTVIVLQNIAEYLFVALMQNAATAWRKKRRNREIKIDPEFLKNIPTPDDKGVFVRFNSGKTAYFTSKDLWEAICWLEKIDPEAAHIFKLRLSGNSISKAAMLMGIAKGVAKAASERGRIRLRCILESMA